MLLMLLMRVLSCPTASKFAGLQDCWFGRGMIVTKLHACAWRIAGLHGLANASKLARNIFLQCCWLFQARPWKHAFELVGFRVVLKLEVASGVLQLGQINVHGESAQLCWWELA